MCSFLTVTLHEVAPVHVAQTQIHPFFWTSLSIESEADHSEVVSRTRLVQLCSPAEAARILSLTAHGSSALQEEFSYEILLQRAQIKLGLLELLDLHEFSSFCASELSAKKKSFVTLDFTARPPCENNATSVLLILCENHTFGFPMLDRNDDDLCPEFSLPE